MLAKPKSCIKQFFFIKTQRCFFLEIEFCIQPCLWFLPYFCWKVGNGRKTPEKCPKCDKFHDNFLHHLFLWVRKGYFCFCYQSFQLPGVKSWYFSPIWAIGKHEGIVISWSMANLSQWMPWQEIFFFETQDFKCLSQAQFRRKLVTVNSNVSCWRCFYRD